LITKPITAIITACVKSHVKPHTKHNDNNYMYTFSLPRTQTVIKTTEKAPYLKILRKQPSGNSEGHSMRQILPAHYHYFETHSKTMFS